MSMFKLAVYGAIGYLVYQTFFADSPTGAGSRRLHGHNDRRQASHRPSVADQGRVEETEDSSGTSVKHRVGRGVI
jgi:hypothetical protein